MNKKKISFLRHYHGYTGGHQKVRDYLAHFINLDWTPTLFLSNKAKTNTNLFSDLDNVVYEQKYQPEAADVAFLAGMDWQYYLPKRQPNQPVINLIQHVRHADPSEQLFKFLQEPAIRLCVSQAVTDAISPYANGPCHTIRMGHRFPSIQSPIKREIYILASKQPELGNELASWATELGYRTLCHTSTQEKKDVMMSMASSRLTVALPHKTEGFFLPGIEAMYYSKMAVVPECVANKEYYSRFANIVMPKYTKQDIQLAIKSALNQPLSMTKMRSYMGKRIAKSYSLENERKELKQHLSYYF
ncbi:hypothetical protein D210916BOD24_27430 [Alteromonas sp. D210916BOD_24]|uniref:glycosyltransferase n=1 Tax=Alteromonas sp. D210916BOD_24 TaxID=3157618 RepID=UPI00399C71F7